jgi:hypothetical protein
MIIDEELVYPSKEFEKYKYKLLKNVYNIFDWVRRRNRKVEGCKIFCDDIEDRILEFLAFPPNGKTDARMYREFIVCPTKDSRRLEIPKESVIKLSKEFALFGLFHVWVRITCPRENETCVETNVSETFVEDLKDCICCGLDHSHDKDIKSTSFYAINLSTPSELENTESVWQFLKRFFKKYPDPDEIA